MILIVFLRHILKTLGRLTNLAAATANDFGLAELVKTRAALMTSVDLHDLTVKAGDVLGAWGATQNLTRELSPVLLSADGKTLIDRGVYVEDATGGYWTLKSGAAVVDAGGAVIARATLQDVLAMAVTGGNHWQLEQGWSPSTRGSALQFREGVPYLTHVMNGRAVVLDYGIQNGDGSWHLASGAAVKDINGAVIANPTKADILAQVPPTGDQWRVEALGFNRFANIPVAKIGLDIVNGAVADYTVRVTDADGSFYVWARNLDRALALQAKQGTSLAFNLRNYEVDFAALEQQVNSIDQSKYRIEVMTPAQLNFALGLSTIEFQPNMLTATLNNQTGIISYAVNQSGNASLSTTSYVSGITQAIGLLNTVFAEYVSVSRSMAVRMALQGGLSSFAVGISYDVSIDKYVSTGKRNLAPMFEAIFNGAPADNTGNAIDHYLANWNDILWRVYPDYVISGGDTLNGGAMAFDQVFLLKEIIEAGNDNGTNDTRRVA